MGRTPTPSSAGNDKKEPPPAMAFRAPARKEAMTNQACCHSGPNSMSVDPQNQALQVFGLGNIQDHGVIRSRLPAFQETNSALRVSGRVGHHAMKLVPGNVVGTGASHQRSARAQHLEGTQVEFLVAAQSAGHSTLGLGKSRWV